MDRKRSYETNRIDRSRRKSDSQKYRVTKTSKLHGQRIAFVIKKGAPEGARGLWSEPVAAHEHGLQTAQFHMVS